MATSKPRVELGQLLCFDLYVASRAVTAVYRPLLGELGLTYPQFLVLVVMGSRGSCTVKDLTEDLQLDYGTVTPLLRRLEGDGLLTRSRDRDDERVVTVALTEAGVAMAERVQRIPDDLCVALDLQLDQIQDLQAALRALTTACSSAPRVPAHAHLTRARRPAP